MENPQESIKDQSARPAVRPLKRRKFRKVLLLLISYVIVGIVVWQISAQSQNDPARAQAQAEAEVKSLVAKVAGLMIVPTEELPQVATVNDAENLAKTQAFFAGVKNGDQVLIYLAAQKAIIYRPSENKIVNVGPVVAENDKAQNPAQTTKTTPATSTKDAAPKSSSVSE